MVAAVKVEGLFAEVQAAVKAIGESRGLNMSIGPVRFEEKRMVLSVYVMPQDMGEFKQAPDKSVLVTYRREGGYGSIMQQAFIPIDRLAALALVNAGASIDPMRDLVAGLEMLPIPIAGGV